MTPEKEGMKLKNNIKKSIYPYKKIIKKKKTVKYLIIPPKMIMFVTIYYFSNE